MDISPNYTSNSIDWFCFSSPSQIPVPIEAPAAWHIDIVYKTNRASEPSQLATGRRRQHIWHIVLPRREAHKVQRLVNFLLY